MQQADRPNLSRFPNAADRCERLQTLRPALERPIAVLDTNVVLDWMLFADLSVAALAAAIERQQVHWLTTAEMRAEFKHVLVRGLAAARGADVAAVLALWDARAETCGAAVPMPRSAGLLCSDPDDQMFLDLAHAAGAHWLFTRDRAVLRLARRAARYGLTITTPQRWLVPA
jgi:predicted nucleic acid-binding protein